MTFFEWLFDIHRPPPTIVRMNLTPLKAIENELIRLHNELASYTSENSTGYLKVVDAVDRLNQELIRKSREVADEAIPTRES